MYIATKILLTQLASITAPDLCDVVNTSTGTPTICVPHEDGAPVYNADVCCTGSTCVKPIRGRCSSTQKRFYCELGEVNSAGLVSCYFEVPYYCEVFPCALEIGIDPQEETICCVNGICTPYYGSEGTCDPANIYHCDSVKLNPDGTVECLDPEEG
jgi:hypothetical protein